MGRLNCKNPFDNAKDGMIFYGWKEQRRQDLPESLAEALEERGIDKEQAVRLLESIRKSLVSEMNNLDMVTDSKDKLIKKLYQKVNPFNFCKNPSFYCLLPLIVAFNDSVLFTEDMSDELLYQFLLSYGAMETVRLHIEDRREKVKTFYRLLNLLDREKLLPSTPALPIEPLMELFIKWVSAVKETDTLRDNMLVLSQQLGASHNLKRIASLFLFKAFTVHQKRLSSHSGFICSTKKLWNNRSQSWIKNDGKNYDRNFRYQQLFQSLCKLCAALPEWDCELTSYGFCEVSDVPLWYYEQMDAESYQTDKSFMSMPTKWVVGSTYRTYTPFTQDELPMCQKYGISSTTIENTLTHPNPKIELILRSFSRYLECHDMDATALDEITITGILRVTKAPIQYLDCSDWPMVYAVITSLAAFTNYLDGFLKLEIIGEWMAHSL